MSQHLFLVQDLPADAWKKVFETAVSIKNKSFSPSKNLTSKKVGLLFFEPSSRTRWSFEKACLDLGVPSMTSVVDSSTSLSKGEANKDSLDLYLHLGFDLIVMRSKAEDELMSLAKGSEVKFINAGFGSDSHPTQAFLDYFTWKTDCSGKDISKILIMGDIKHSRVARSHLRLAKIFNYQVGLLPAPGFELSSAEASELGSDLIFADRAEALDWAEVVMPLRSQKERHESNHSGDDFAALSSGELKEDHFIMHPGPFMRNVDLDESLIKDDRSLIFKQKQNGVYCRAALLSCMLS